MKKIVICLSVVLIVSCSSNNTIEQMCDYHDRMFEIIPDYYDVIDDQNFLTAVENYETATDKVKAMKKVIYEHELLRKQELLYLSKQGLSLLT